MITNTKVPIGYENVENSNVYVNENVLPIGYSTTKVISKDVYDNLDYPEKNYALISNVVLEGVDKTEYKERTKKEELKYESEYKYLTLRQEDDKYIIQSEKDGNIILQKLDLIWNIPNLV